MAQDLRQIICSELSRLNIGPGIINSIYAHYLKEQMGTASPKHTSYVNGRIGAYEFVVDTLTANDNIESQYFVMFKKGERHIFRYWPDLGMGVLSGNSSSSNVFGPEEAIRKLLIKAFDLTSDGKFIKNPVLAKDEVPD